MQSMLALTTFAAVILYSLIGIIVFVVSFVLAAGAWALFLRRDIRVGGERSWRWRGLRRA